MERPDFLETRERFGGGTAVVEEAVLAVCGAGVLGEGEDETTALDVFGCPRWARKAIKPRSILSARAPSAVSSILVGSPIDRVSETVVAASLK